MEGAADQGRGVELCVRGGDDLRVAVPEVDRRVGGQAPVEVVAGHHDIARSGSNALDIDAPLAGHLDTALHGLRAASDIARSRRN